MPEPRVVFAGDLPAAIQTARAANDARHRHESGDFTEPSPPVEYPLCRWCRDPLVFGVCVHAECSAKDADSKYARIDEEMERGDA